MIRRLPIARLELDADAVPALAQHRNHLLAIVVVGDQHVVDEQLTLASHRLDVIFLQVAGVGRERELHIEYIRAGQR